MTLVVFILGNSTTEWERDFLHRICDGSCVLSKSVYLQIRGSEGC